MKQCNCSERPLEVLKTKYIAENNIPFQVLEYGCVNKSCTNYQKVVVERKINLLDNSETEKNI